MPKTNNSCEGWHRRFNSILASHHPSLWKLIEALKKEQNNTEIVFEQSISGYKNNNRKVYKERAEKILKIVTDYKKRTFDEYLSGLSHNFDLQID